MPEGPEVAREADRIRAAIAGEPLERVHFAFPHLARRAPALVGDRVVDVRARGKAMLIRLEGGATIYSHNQLYGRWYVRRIGSVPRTARQLRLALETRTHAALLYSASEIDLLDEAALAGHPYLAKLGPDALDAATDRADLEQCLRDPRFRRRTLAALLLDQSFVAGLGNYLRSEIAFEARIDPARRPAELSDAERRRVARAILTISRRAYATGGVTLPAQRAAALRRAGAGWSEARHWVFDRAGEGCRRCHVEVQRSTLAGRRLYRCPSCQPAG
jgi:endonuclease-8